MAKLAVVWNIRLLNFILIAGLSISSKPINLDLSLNELRSLHALQGSFSKIQKLDLSYNFLPPTALVDLANLQCLRSLILVGNELASIPSNLGFQTLEDLNLNDNKLRAAADIANLAQLPNLRRLSLANNEFTSFPILRVETRAPASKAKCSKTPKPWAQPKTAEFEVVFDDIVTHNGVERLISACIPKHQALHCSRKSIPHTTSLRQISPHRKLFKQPTKMPIKTASSNPPLIFPRLMYLDMGENMLAVEEAIIPVVACPNLRVLSIYGNPLIEEFCKAPPKLQTILVEQRGISIECERSKFWRCKCSTFGATKLDQQRRDHLPPLTAAVKSADEEFEGNSTVDVSKAHDSNVHPLFPQHELSIEFNRLPKGIQRCLREFKSMDAALKESEMGKVEDANVSPTADSNFEPKWIRNLGNGDESLSILITHAVKFRRSVKFNRSCQADGKFPALQSKTTTSGHQLRRHGVEDKGGQERPLFAPFSNPMALMHYRNRRFLPYTESFKKLSKTREMPWNRSSHPILLPQHARQ
ncbi:X-ray radiation resistance-associated protein 1 [Taenia crassiceps]|uniref:X-ray radiation resistance-associated protein 1 n=1 Tax=Taenia crassiceps TaxID=6207 RepID=A0ABR4Q4T2_9CEST